MIHRMMVNAAYFPKYPEFCIYIANLGIHQNQFTDIIRQLDFLQVKNTYAQAVNHVAGVEFIYLTFITDCGIDILKLFQQKLKGKCAGNRIRIWKIMHPDNDVICFYTGEKLF
nr:hypothetical protein [Parasporobacterium paucivorans]